MDWADPPSPTTGGRGIVVGSTKFGPVVQDLVENRMKGAVGTVTMISVRLLADFQRTDGGGALLTPNDGPVSLPNSIAQSLIQSGAAIAA